jgi:hypothetical protein
VELHQVRRNKDGCWCGTRGLHFKLMSQGEGPPLEFLAIPDELAGIVDGVLLLPGHRFGRRTEHDDEDIV